MKNRVFCYNFSCVNVSETYKVPPFILKVGVSKEQTAISPFAHY